MRHGILPTLGAAALIAPGLATQGTTPAPVPTRDAQEEERRALDEKVRRYLDSLREATRGRILEERWKAPEERLQQDLASKRVSQGLLLDGSLDREAWRRQILARIDRRIAEAVERLRVEVRAIVEEELARAEPGPVEDVDEARLGAAWRLELFRPSQPWMGVELAAEEGAESLKVKRVLPVSPAAEAGLREGDRILSVLGIPVADRAELGAVLGTRMPGDRVELKVRREGEEVVLFLVLGLPPEGRSAAVDEDDEEARLAAERAEPAAPREARLGDDMERIKIGFEETETGKPPKGWSFARTGEGPEGKWTVENDGENSVLKQSSADSTNSRYPVAVLDGKQFGDFTLTARFRPISGEVDQAGGVVFRYVDANRYLICRANALEGNFRLYTVIDGKRQQLKSQDVKVLAKEWHAIRVECRGKEVKCSFDGGTPLVAEIEGFAPGKVGFWTKADSVTLFDDLEVEPIKK
ncbi:MAG: PDZ domain-containing protein [Planctomycetes bacterium]|nr:PDZ domain-containing protein [Planctomycetota bacterium]